MRDHDFRQEAHKENHMKTKTSINIIKNKKQKIPPIIVSCNTYFEYNLHRHIILIENIHVTKIFNINILGK